jgi:c-di-GMP-binding flagellar brake protein YcgR
MKLSKILKRLFRPRLHHRYSVDNGVLVLIEPHAVAYRKVQMLDISKRNQVQMLNISEGGCAFIYNGSRKDLEASGLLSLHFKDILCLERVGFVTKSDSLLSDSNDKKEQLRIRSVEFQWMGILDRKKLKEFIKQNAIART